MALQVSKRQRAIIKKHAAVSNEWYSLRRMLSYAWAMYLFLIGGRETGKSYAVTDFFVRQFLMYGRPFYWLRLSERSQQKLLANNAEKLIDPDIKRKYGIETVTRGENVYYVKYGEPDENGKREIIEKKLMARVLAIGTFYNDKGQGYFDKDFLDDPTMYYNICLDEMNREKNEKKTFDIVYSFANQLENLIRSTKTRVRIICIGNYLEEASDILTAFNFIPEEFGIYKLKSKRAVIEYIEPSEKYLERRKGTAADILAGDNSTFTNKMDTDTTMVTKQALTHPNAVVVFSKTQKYTIWNSNIVAVWHGEKKPEIYMRPYLDGTFIPEKRDQIFLLFDTRGFKYHNLITYKKFKQQLELLKPSR